MNVVLNDEMTIAVPEELRMLSEAEREKLPFAVKGPGECFSNEEKHILISVGWRKVRPFANLFVKPEEIAHRDEQMIRKAMKNYDYVHEEFTHREIGAEQAEGYRYIYKSADGTDMVGESVVLKHNKHFYYFHFYTRVELRGENAPVWEEFLKTVNF